MSRSLAAISMLLVAGSALAQGSCAVRTPQLQGRYVGDCLNGFASGRGVAQGVDRYEGSFRDGHPTGPGIYTFADGRRFEGDFIDGQVQGRARFVYANGDVLEGSFRDSQLVGMGRMLRPSGEVLLVEMRSGALAVVASAAPAPVPVSPAPVPVTPGPITPSAPSAASPALPAATQGAAVVPGAAAGPEATVEWQPRLDMDALYPAYVLATATRKPPSAPAAGSRAARPRGDELARQLIPPPEARSRVASFAAGATYLGDPWGLVGIRLRSQTAASLVNVKVLIDDVAEPTEETFRLGPPGEYALYPKLRYRYDRLRAVGQPVPVNVTWTLTVDGRPAGTRTVATQLRPTMEAPFLAVNDRGEEMMSWVFAAFVTEDAPWIDGFLQQAFAGYVRGPVGYQLGPEAAIAQVGIVFEHLKKLGIKYSSITRTSGASTKVAAQAVRFPSDSIRNTQANCVDGSVLLASILRRISIEPVLVLGPGHMMLGFFSKWPLKGDEEFARHFHVVETTRVATHSFEAARQEGDATYREWLAKHREDPSFDLVLVSAARRAGVASIAR